MSDSRKTLGSACKRYEEDLVLYYYGECSEAERDRVEHHLKECNACDRFLEDLRSFLPGMAQNAEYPQDFWDGYFQELQEKLAVEENRRSWWRTLFAGNRLWAVPALGTAMVLLVASALVFNRLGPNPPGPTTQEPLPAEIIADAGKLDFFRSMDLLDSLQTLEALDGTRPEIESTHKL